MPKFVTNIEATTKAVDRARLDAEQLRRSISEIGLYVAANDRMRIALLNQVDQLNRLVLDGLWTLSRDTKEAS